MGKVELELKELRDRVERLEMELQRLRERREVVPPPQGTPPDPGEVIAWLKARGLIAEPPPGARLHAERWAALSESEKEAITRELENLPPGPMASEIISQNRR